jgi:NADPH:quinone reductase-like Zn-dependent oxidoreductase
VIDNNAQPENGAFSRFIAVKGDLQIHIPDDISFEAVSTVRCGIGAVGFGLYKILDLPLPGTNQDGIGTLILIYGGSIATRTLAIQFARL